jgi:hypothetical protein
MNLFGSLMLFSLISLIKETLMSSSVGLNKDLIPVGDSMKVILNPNVTVTAKKNAGCKRDLKFLVFSLLKSIGNAS